MKWLKNFFRESGLFDELSLFLIGVALILSIILMFLRLNGYIIFTWILILLGYWRTLSKNKMARERENQAFLKIFYPVKSLFVNRYRKATTKDGYRYFDCKSCSSSLRLPKTAKNVKVTCPKCKHSFIKRTLSSQIKNLLKKAP